MWPLPPLLYLLLPAALFVAAHGAGDLQGFSFHGGTAGFDPTDPCMVVFPPCLSEADRFSLEALSSIHQMMDDDQDGGIEVEESVEFIIEDMKQQQTNKHSHLHREDQHITVEELWKGWKSSEVHNWTQDDVLRWLKDFVELPQYERNFKDFKVNGNTLPRIAANEPSFLSGHLKVQDQRDKQKLNIKALDVVLFGPPTRPPHNYMKDFLLIVSVVMGVGGCWFAQAQNKASKIHITKMMKDLESLQRAEQSLTDLQEQLERAQEEKRNVAEEKQNLEEKMRDEIMGAQEEAHRLHELRQGAVTELSRLRYAEEELVQVRGALKRAEKDMQASWNASEALQQWLQLTHEVEVEYYNVKKQSAELQLAIAKEEAERIKKKRSSVFGTLHVAHSSSLDQVDHKILEAKNALAEVTACLRERLHRWQQIERLCGFPVIRNPGLANLSAQLYSDSMALGLPRVPQPSCSCRSSIHGSMEDLMEESPIMQQIPVQPLKRSPRNLGSTICRTRRPGVITQPTATMLSADPDLLLPIRAPYPCFDEGDGFFIKTLKKQDSQERYSDTEYPTSPPQCKVFPAAVVDASSRKFYYDDSEALLDSAMTNPLSKDIEVVEPPIRKVSIDDLESSCRKLTKERSFENPMENPNPESLTEASLRKPSRDRSELPVDVEFLSRKKDRDIKAELDSSSRNICKDKNDAPLEARRLFWNEVESDLGPRKISKDMLGFSVDSSSRRLVLEELDHPFDHMSKSVTRELMATDVSSRRLDTSVRAMEKMSDSERTTSKKISIDECEYYSNAAALRKPTRDPFERLVDISPAAEHEDEFCLEPTASRRVQREDLEMPFASQRRRMPRVPRESIDSSIDTPTGKICWDKVDVPIDIPKHSGVREKMSVTESISPLVATGQPDLTATSQQPWMTSADTFAVGPLSKLVYDGILEKSCNTVAIPTASTTTIPQMPEPPQPPAQVVPQSTATTAESEERNKDKEKSKKSMKLKNLFKKKNEPTPEKLQSGLQKL
ncbi:stromal interaction molecule 2-like [Synchiropus splendidus]|uniref:stromal interaction molecule 2-like n=1 Tax=Synchiropus splendidus TaxID=270530 RepID=UPI00237D8BB3|nr:stromal interaction molecule 2-like [Synchiropus splendidus]